MNPLINAHVDDTPVHDLGGDKLGTLSSFHIERHSGQVQFAVISFGGLLGLGQSYHPIPFALLQVNEEKGGYTATIDKTVFDGGPSYRPDNAPQWDASYAGRVTDYYAKRLPNG